MTYVTARSTRKIHDQLALSSSASFIPLYEQPIGQVYIVFENLFQRLSAVCPE